MLTDDSMLNALRQDYEPRRDLVSFGMVEAIQIREGAVAVILELTTPACPLKARSKAETRVPFQAMLRRGSRDAHPCFSVVFSDLAPKMHP